MYNKYNINLYQEDCIKGMDKIEDKSVDMILTDLPYGTTACKWDVVIPFNELWKQYKRIIKDNGAILLFGDEPFSSMLRLSNLEWYRYDLYWVKEKPVNFFQLKRRFGKVTETVSIFYKEQPTYNPQKYKVGYRVKNVPKGSHKSIITGMNKEITPYKDDGTRYPNNLLYFNRVKLGDTIHETEKPVKLLEYLIKTFSNEGDLILDSTFGSGSAAEACLNLDRKFVGYEDNADIFNKAILRIDEAIKIKKRSLF